MQEPILIYTPTLTARLDYICKFIFRDLLQVPFVFTTSIAKVASHNTFFINYSDTDFENGLQIIPHSLITESNIRAQIMDQGEWQNTPCFFETKGSFIKFDIFSASFYLLSRYEEYLEIKKDEYDRFPHTLSIAHLRQFLHLPLIDVWCHKMFTLLRQQIIELTISPKSFSSIRTFDVDMITAYQHKGFVKNAGGFFRDVVNKNWAGCKQRWQVLFGNQKDSFDSFAEIENFLTKKRDVIFFFLMSDKPSEYDKNLRPNHSAMHQLIKKIGQQFDIAIHPSYQSNATPTLAIQELQHLQQISGKKITKSRQHYIKFSMPKTYQQLLKTDIAADYSMGYGSINGFRASTCTPFYWFDVSTNKSTALQVVPFCWMDANCVYEQKMTTQEALENWKHYFEICKKYNGLFVDVWHNFIIGNGNYNKHWMDVWMETVEIGK